MRIVCEEWFIVLFSGLTTPVEMKLKLIPILTRMHHDISTATQVEGLIITSFSSIVQPLPLPLHPTSSSLSSSFVILLCHPPQLLFSPSFLTVPPHCPSSPSLLTVPPHRPSSPSLFTVPPHLPSSPSLLTFPLHLPSSPSLLTVPPHLPSSPSLFTVPPHRPSSPSLLTFPPHRPSSLLPFLALPPHTLSPHPISSPSLQVRDLCVKLLPSYPSLSFVTAILHTLTELAIATVVHMVDQVGGPNSDMLLLTP